MLPIACYTFRSAYVLRRGLCDYAVLALPPGGGFHVWVGLRSDTNSRYEHGRRRAGSVKLQAREPSSGVKANSITVDVAMNVGEPVPDGPFADTNERQDGLLPKPASDQHRSAHANERRSLLFRDKERRDISCVRHNEEFPFLNAPHELGRRSSVEIHIASLDDCIKY